MKIGIITLIVITLLPQIVGATDNIPGKMDQLIKQADPDLNIGIKITNLDQGKVIFEKNADRYFIPASTLKFVTIVSILEHFDENYNFTIMRRSQIGFDLIRRFTVQSFYICDLLALSLGDLLNMRLEFEKIFK